MAGDSTMRAFVLTGHGGPEALELRGDHPRPRPAPDEALVRVRACGLNNTDVNTRVGWYSRGADGATTGAPPSGARDGDASWGGGGLSFPRVQGADICGVVEETGPEADAALVGRRVLVDPWVRNPNDPLDGGRAEFLGSERDGGFAEFAAVPARRVHPIESPLSDAELATFATSYSTAENMLRRAGLEAGETLLATGASGGVGSALIQLARRRGARVVAMCGEGGGKAEAARRLGAEAVLPRGCEDLRGALAEAAGRAEVDVVADVVGGAGWPRLLDALARGGRLACSGAVAGPVAPLDLRTLYLRDLTLHGATVPPPGLFADLVGMIERGEARPLLAASHPLERLREAQEEFLRRGHFGKIAVVVE